MAASSAWVSVKDKLPPDDERVLAWLPRVGRVEVAKYSARHAMYGQATWSTQGGIWFTPDEWAPSHWMALPKGPEEGPEEAA